MKPMSPPSPAPEKASVPGNARKGGLAAKLQPRIERAVLRAVLATPPKIAALQKPHRVDGDPLCPQIQLFLKLLNGVPRPSLADVPLEDARAQYEMICALTDGEGPEVPYLREASIPGAESELTVRIYGPEAKPSRPLPALVYYHGGGFVIGSRNVVDAFCRRVALGARCLVFNVEYRLAPEHPFPAAVVDCTAAFDYIHANAAALGVDPDRIAVGGDSAGGNLATVVSIARRDADKPGPCHQMLYYPVTQPSFESESHRLFADGYFLDRKVMDFFMSSYGASGTNDPRSAPMLYSDLSKLPPAQVLTAGFDPLRDEGREYAERLRDAGNAVEYVNEGRLIHGFVAMNFSKIAREANQRAIRRLGAALEA